MQSSTGSGDGRSRVRVPRLLPLYSCNNLSRYRVISRNFSNHHLTRHEPRDEVVGGKLVRIEQSCNVHNCAYLQKKNGGTPTVLAKAHAAPAILRVDVTKQMEENLLIQELRLEVLRLTNALTETRLSQSTQPLTEMLQDRLQIEELRLEVCIVI
jgi:hypothetical protein